MGLDWSKPVEWVTSFFLVYEQVYNFILAKGTQGKVSGGEGRLGKVSLISKRTIRKGLFLSLAFGRCWVTV